MSASIATLEPLALSAKHRHIALLDLDGYSNVEIAAKVGDNENRIAVVRTSPLYQAYLADLRERLEAKRVETIDELIVSQVRPSIEALIAIRDNHSGKVPATAQARAAETLLDKVIPKAAPPDVDGGTHSVILTEAAAARLANILVEAGVQLGAKKPMQNITPLDDSIDVSAPNIALANALLAEQ